MNIFEAIRWLQDKPEGTELVSKELRLSQTKNRIMINDGFYMNVYFLLSLEHADFQPVVDWSKVPVDTKVLVRNGGHDKWEKRHFCKKNGEYYECFNDGMTSWTCGETYSDEQTFSWKYCKLAEVE